MFLGNRATLLNLVMCVGIAIASLLLYAIEKNTIFILAGEVVVVGILLRTDKLTVMISRASFSLMSVATFITSQNVVGSVLFLFSAVFLLHSPMFLILNPPSSKVVLRRIMGSAFLLVFLMAEEKIAVSILFVLCCLFLLLQDYLALKKRVKRVSRSGQNTSKKA